MDTILPVVKLNQGIHVMHLFYRVDRRRWAELGRDESALACAHLEKICSANSQPSHPRLVTYANVSGKADFAFLLQAAELGKLAQMHRDIENCFAPGALIPVFSYFSVTELSEYMPTEEESRRMLIEHEKLSPDSEEFKTKMAESNKRRSEYEHYRLYPELPDWEIMGFYPMSKRRLAADNWYSLDFDMRKKLMGGHARVGRKFAGRVSQLITGSTGLD